MVDQLPPPDSYACFKERTRLLRALLHVSENSAGRTAKHNLAVGGSPLSKHQIWFGNMAEDWHLDDMTDANRTAAVETCRVAGLWAKDEVNHVHVQALPPGAERLPWKVK